jgi:hypothetical protein
MKRFILFLVTVAACSAERPPVVDSAITPPDSPRADTARSPVSVTIPSIPVLVAVRAARHDSVERVVFEFRGDSVPALRITSGATPPVDCGSGEAKPVRGQYFLSVDFQPAYAHEFNGEQARSSVPSRQITPNLPVVQEIRITCDFEAVVAWTIGLDARRPYVVDTLTRPTRIVVDIKH